MAASHAAIMDAVYTLLQEKSVRDLTMEEVAKRAKVGKPTLYKWWPTKATLVLAMLCERMAPNLEKPSDLTAEDSLRFRVRSLIDAFKGPFGKIVAGLISESQSEPGTLQQFLERWVSPRRTATIADRQRGKNTGELRSEAEPEVLNRRNLWSALLPPVTALGPIDQTVWRGLGRTSHPRSSLGANVKAAEQAACSSKHGRF
jgi:AcrR family transcriptional regulator